MDADGYPDEGPPPDAGGDDRPDEHEDELDDLNEEFEDPETRQDAADDLGADSDDESLLSEVDEAQFADFDPKAVEVAPDFDTLKSIKVNKRKRAEGEEPAAKKKKKEKRRERPSRRADSEHLSGGDAVEGKRRQRTRAPVEGRRETVEINEDDLTPEERRRRTLDRLMDAAVKRSSGKRMRKGDGIVSISCKSWWFNVDIR